MNKLVSLLLPLLFSVNFSIAQVSEGTIIHLGFYKVEDEMRAEYETVMKEYFGKVMKERVKKGCMENWIFRRVLPYTDASNQFTHMTIDVLKPGQTNYWCDEVTFENAFPEVSEELRTLFFNVRNRSRKVVYRTIVSYVDGFNRDNNIAKLAAYNFIKTYPGKGADYRNMHKEYMKDFFMNYSNQSAWHAFVRTDPSVRGSEEWNYLTMDGYDSMEHKRERSVNVPENLVNEVTEKYGSTIDLRDLKYMVVAELIMAASE